MVFPRQRRRLHSDGARRKREKGGGKTFMRGRLPRYYHQRNEREGTVIEVKRDSRPFMGYGIVTMKLALG